MTRWKLVPEEPTPRMIFAGREQLARGEAVYVYDAMLAVSPIYQSADGLVERLRDFAGNAQFFESKLCREAADALSAQSVEIARLRTELQNERQRCAATTLAVTTARISFTSKLSVPNAITIARTRAVGSKTSIEWTATVHADGTVTPGASWNPIRARHTGQRTDLRYGQLGWHCTHVSEGCRYCYAEGINRRLGTGLDYKPGHEKDIEIFLDEKMLLQPLRWKRPRKIFVGSMTDLFGAFVTDDQLDRIFAVMALCPQHTFQLLTKRPERMRKYVVNGRIRAPSVNETIPGVAIKAAREKIAVPNRAIIDAATHGLHLLKWPLHNVWLGTSCEDQPTADERIPHLLATPAAVRFLSCEPLLGPITIPHSAWCGVEQRLHWVIAGGESGQHARPMRKAWATSLRDQCADAGAAFFYKQWGEWIDADEWHNGPFMERQPPLNFSDAANLAALGRGARGYRCEHQSDGTTMLRVGKSRAGRMIDGIEHNAFPEGRG